jgi:flagellin
MSRINTNVASLTAQRGLARSQKSLDATLQRLSTGLRINRGADDPAGLIASEGLRSEIAGITQSIDNSQRASNVIATTEGALNEVASLLLTVKDLVVEAANTGAFSQEEIKANQLQVDSAIESITRISNTTTFAGLKLLNGSLDYLTSGVNTNAIRQLDISQASFGTATNIPVEVDLLTVASAAALRFTGSSLTQSVTIEITGNKGVDILTFTSGATASQIALAVNRIADATGVVANFTSLASGVSFRSVDFGSKNFVSVVARSGSFAVENNAGAVGQRAVGVDATATINGAFVRGDGLSLSLNTASLDLNLTLDSSFGVGATRFAITGGGALFQLGPQVSSQQQVNIGIQSIAATRLGDSISGFLSDVRSGGSASLLSGNTATASEIIEKAIRQVSGIRGRLGAFERNTIETNINSLSVALENVTASESTIRDADFARETAALTRSQILTQAGTSVLATANSTPQQVLSLLQQ